MSVNETEISPVYAPIEIELAKMRMTEIRFDCIVKMYDCGTREVKGFMPYASKSLPPQWFKAQNKLTLEFIVNSDERTIGRVIKEMYNQLEGHIKQYEER